MFSSEKYHQYMAYVLLLFTSIERQDYFS